MMFSFHLRSLVVSFRGVAVITSASHAEGPQFDPGRKQFWGSAPNSKQNSTAERIHSDEKLRHDSNELCVIRCYSVLFTGSAKELRQRRDVED